MLEDYFNGVKDDYKSYFSNEEEHQTILEAARTLRDNFLNSTFYETIKDAEKHPEQEFLIRDGDNLIEGIIDLLCITEDKVVIVDYKTDSIRYEKDHRNQLLFYTNAMKTIYPEKTIEAYVFYLRSPEDVLSIK
ncbi:MAG: PD-(D/E)XK nuclease family protein [Spirochaetales bacterium]|nr:PD-(D/E)XK nuclease family protein [Candidatus Physcosoma equi]